jgi:hypothetical protein
MEGRAMLTEEPIKGVRNEVKVAMSKAGLLFPVSFKLMLSIITNF